MKKILSIVILSLLFVFVFAGTAKAWFGAGSTPGWDPTSSGLRGEIALPEYKFSPDFYSIGDTVDINTRGFNLGAGVVASHYYLAIRKVTEAPIGTNISNGTPTTPGLNENQLYDFHKSNNDVQVPVTVIDLGDQTFNPGEWHQFAGSFVTNDTGYYQFDFMDINPNNGDYQGHILTAGFFRVLNLKGQSSPSPIPCDNEDKVCPVPPSPTATPTSTPALNCPEGKHLNLQGTECLAFELGGPPPPPSAPSSGGKVLGASTVNDPGQVLGAHTLGATGSSYDYVGLSLIAAGAVIAVISGYEIKKTL